MLCLIFTDFKFFVKIIYNHFYGRNSGKNIYFQYNHSCRDNSINTNKFKYDEAKNLEPEEKYSLRRILFKFSCQILQNYLYCVKSLF